MKALITLGACGYYIEVQDLQVIFTEASPVAFCPVTQFALQRPKDINNSNGIWYLCQIETSDRGIPVSHIEDAINYCRENFGANFSDYKGELAK